jgi:hypothetical protein
MTKDEADRTSCRRNSTTRIRRHRLQLLAIHPGQRRGGAVGRQRRQLGQDHRPRSCDAGASSPTQVHARDGARCRGVTDLGIFHVLGQPNLNIKVDREKAARYGLNTGDVNTVVQAALGGAWRPRCWRATASSTSSCGLPPEYRATARRGRATSRSAIRRRRHQRLYSAERARRHHARYRRLLHLSRAQPALHSDQVQRARPRSRRRRRRSAGAHRQAT